LLRERGGRPGGLRGVRGPHLVGRAGVAAHWRTSWRSMRNPSPGPSPTRGGEQGSPTSSPPSLGGKGAGGLGPDNNSCFCKEPAALGGERPDQAARLEPVAGLPAEFVHFANHPVEPEG